MMDYIRYCLAMINTAALKWKATNPNDWGGEKKIALFQQYETSSKKIKGDEKGEFSVQSVESLTEF